LVKVALRNWPITVECKRNSWLWLVNFLLFSLIHIATAHCRPRISCVVWQGFSSLLIGCRIERLLDLSVL